jgi:hypothetical protein
MNWSCSFKFTCRLYSNNALVADGQELPGDDDATRWDDPEFAIGQHRHVRAGSLGFSRQSREPLSDFDVAIRVKNR